MSEEPSTPGVFTTPETAEAAETAAPDPTAIFLEAYDCAKNNYNWTKVVDAVSNHPEWLVRVPHGRRWTMLHQIVFCGNVTRLQEILAHEINNDEFRFLCKALDDKTVREVAAERAHVHPQMMHYVERLVALDQMLHNAKENKWELVRQFLHQQPTRVNEKPPFKNFYLVHYLASKGLLDILKDLQQICQFKFGLLSEGKTVSQIARENNHIEFAEYVENLPPDAEETPSIDEPTPTGATGGPSHVSPGFFDDPGITIFSMGPTGLTSFLLNGNPSNPTYHIPYDTHENVNPHHAAATADHASTQPKPKPSMTPEQVDQYESTIKENITAFSSEDLLPLLTCCITKSIFRDPVLAADGFTYEHEAILRCFEDSNRSPITNQELDNLELKPNHAIKSILQAVFDVKKAEKNSHETNNATV